MFIELYTLTGIEDFYAFIDLIKCYLTNKKNPYDLNLKMKYKFKKIH